MSDVKISKNHSKISQMINLAKPDYINISVFYSINNWENYESVNLILESNSTISQLLNTAVNKFKNEYFYDDIDNKDLDVMLFKKKIKKPNYDYPICRILGSCCMGGVIIYIFGRVSGAHFNPAVSLGLFIRHKLSGMELVLYIVAQLLGGFLGCVFVGLCRRGKFKKMAGNAIDYYLITTYRNSTSKNGWCYVSAFLFEIFGTFILVMFILASCERDNYLGPALGLAFSSVLIALSGIGGRISGCSLNPARSFAPALVQVMAGGNKDPIKQIWIT